jgi:PKD repeat protein
MRTSYELSGKYINFSLTDNYIKQNEANNQNIIGFGASVAIYDLYNYHDRMSVEPSGYAFEHPDEKWMNLFGYYPEDIGVGIGTTGFFVGYKTFQRAIETTSKAMLLALLDGDSKRTTTIGIGSTRAKLDIFHNTLKNYDARDLTKKPWINWNDSVGICTPVSIARTDNVATVTTNPAHGMSTLYDDWGIVMDLNTGIGTESFNISTSSYPNGVPIVITSPTTFTYRNVGINTNVTSVTGTVDIKVGWGGTSNNLHLYIY